MKIYFAGSIRGGRQDAGLYLQLIDYLRRYGEVLTEHIGDKSLLASGEDSLSEEYIHDRDIEWVLDSDVLVAEVSTASLGVGYEIGRAIENNKRVLCLYRSHKENRLSAMIAGSPQITNVEYKNVADAKTAIDKFFE